MPDIVTGETTIHVESRGSGRPVILIHGWPLSGEAWDPQVPALVAAGFRVITYDRRGFGRSGHPAGGFDYDTLTADLAAVLEQYDLRDVTLVGFSMGGGEVARYIATYGEDRLHSVVFAAAVPPCLMQSDDNRDGPLTAAGEKAMEDSMKADRLRFFDSFTKNYFSAHGQLKVSEGARLKALALCVLSDPAAALGCLKAFSTADFRADLGKVTVPALVLHGDADAIVPFEGSGARTYRAIPQSQRVLLAGAPHGMNVSHADAFNGALITFLQAKNHQVTNQSPPQGIDFPAMCVS